MVTSRAAAGLPRPSIDLNADAGEGFDAPELFRWISSASIACGGHAGDPATMKGALELCRACGVAAGAHPGYEDRDGFGREETGLAAAAIGALVERQVAGLAGLAAAAGVPLAHWKPHGALYHRLSGDTDAARAAVAGAARVDPGLAVLGFPGSALLDAARAAGVAAVAEGFADRGYTETGRLVARGAAGALLDAGAAAAQAVVLARRGEAGSLCVHSDTPGAPEIARAARQGLEAAGFDVASGAPAERRIAVPELHVVGAAWIAEGRVLLTRRSAAMPMPGKWEFPGGKVEPEETDAGALVREVEEELGVTLEIGDFIGRGTALVDRRRIVLDVYRARRISGEIRLTEHDAYGWFTGSELGSLDWPEADLPILGALARSLAGDADGSVAPAGGSRRRQSSDPRPPTGT